MTTKTYVAETRYTEIGPFVRRETRAAKWYDFIPAFWLFIRIVWRKWENDCRISASTAWSVAKSVHDLT